MAATVRIAAVLDHSIVFYRWCPYVGYPIQLIFLGPTRVNAPNGISIGSAVFAEVAVMTNMQTDTQSAEPYRLVPIPRRHLRCATQLKISETQS